MTNYGLTPHFHYQKDSLLCENVPLSEIAGTYGTPCYVYSRKEITERYLSYTQAFGEHPHQICYAVKANGNVAVLNVLAQLGAGFDIVSVGELERVIAAGGDTSKVIFSGVGKLDDEIKRALEVGIGCFNIESEVELDSIQRVAAELNIRAPISFRVNPDVDAQTHPYISTGLQENKFGVPIESAVALYKKASAMSHIDITGVDCHIGSQLTNLSPLLDAFDRVLSLVDALSDAGIEIDHIDMGGGLGVRYKDEVPPTAQEYVSALLQKLATHTSKSYAIRLEPGRSIIANAGALVTQVAVIKPTAAKNFAIVDAAMNDLLRPALYQAWQHVLPVQKNSNTETTNYDIVGPVCETGDFLAKNRQLALETGDLLAVMSSGAYGFVMSSNYNARNRAAEILVDGDEAHLIRRREMLSDQLALERLLP